MILGDNNPEEVSGGGGHSTAVLMVDLVKRDFRLWLLALRRRWLVLVVTPLVVVPVAYLVLWIVTPVVYESSCALVRYEVAAAKNNGMPDGYSPVQQSVVLNMLRSRNNLQQTIDNLGLHMTPGQLFAMTTISLPEKRSNYLYVIVRTPDSELSSKIANTLSSVFVDDYKQLIRSNLVDVLNTFQANGDTLRNEIEKLTVDYKNLSDSSKVHAIEAELALNNERIDFVGRSIQAEETQLSALNSKRSSLQNVLDQTPEEVQVYEEKSTERQTSLESAKLELARLQQQYTADNPIVIKQSQIVLMMEKELKEAEASNAQSKVVYGKNMVFLNLRTEVIKTEAELSGAASRIKSYREKLEELEKDRIRLKDLQPKFQMLDDQIQQKRRLLSSLQESKKGLEMFLERSYSDISIYERAVAPMEPVPTHRTIKSMIAGAAGELLALLIILALEAINLRVRSRVDVESALHLPLLGMVPALSTKKRSLFYSSLQSTVNLTELMLDGSSPPAVVAVAPFCEGDLDNELQAEFLELVDLKNIEVLLIRCGEEFSAEECKFLINDYLYGLSEEVPHPNSKGELFFKLDDMSFISPPSEERLGALKQACRGYGLILIDLFDYEENPQLFGELCANADLTVIPMRFDSTEKLTVFRRLTELRERRIGKVAAILYNVDVKSYPMVS